MNEFQGPLLLLHLQGSVVVISVMDFCMFALEPRFFRDLIFFPCCTPFTDFDEAAFGHKTSRSQQRIKILILALVKYVS